MLNGQKLQGPPTAEEVNFMLKGIGKEDRSVVLFYILTCWAA